MDSEENPADDTSTEPAQTVQIEQLDDAVEEEVQAAPEREKWGSRVAYILTLVGYAVGFGNIWRFPYQMRENGGLAFLVPYSFMLGVVGIPMFFLELAVGQRRRKGVVYAWAEASPAFGGIGIACGWLCFMVGLYYNTLIAYCLSYFFDSFRSPLPWTDCKTAATVAGERDKTFQTECVKNLHGRATKYYWYKRTLEISEGIDDAGGYNWYLCLYHIIVWVAIFGILVKGTKSVGAVVYVTAVLPYAVLLMFFLANCAIEPSKGWLGAYRLLKPNWTVLYSPITWLKAGTQIFFSLGVAYGCLVVFASYSPARNNCYKDAISISLINCGTSIFAALVVFPMVGLLGHNKYEECVMNMAKAINSPKLTASLTQDKYDIYFFTNAKEWSEVDSGSNNITIRYGYGELTADDKQSYKLADHPGDILERINQTMLNQGFLAKAGPLDPFLHDCSIGQEATKSGGGTGFVFMGFTEAVKQMPGSNFWSILFFLMLLTLGIDSGFGTIEGAIAAVQDLTSLNRLICTSIICGVMAVLSLLLFPFGWGPYVLDLLDQWTANWTFLVIALMECIAIGWVYGLAKISYDIRLMTGSKPNLYILLCWKYISPITIILLLVGSVSQFIYSSVKTGAIEYTIFNSSVAETDGDVAKPMPGYALVIGFFLLIFCIVWVPLHFYLRKTKWNLLKKQAPSDFPEAELREERNINVAREEDQFTVAEKAIMGQRSLLNLQEDRDRQSKTELVPSNKKGSGVSL